MKVENLNTQSQYEIGMHLISGMTKGEKVLPNLGLQNV